MSHYKIKEVSRMTSLSVRALQYYDDIHLLKPTWRTAAGYRLYSDEDLLRLQQITTLKFLGFPLSAIKNIIENPRFDVMTSLDIQAKELSKKASKINEAASLLTYIASQMEMKQPINWKSNAKIIEILEINSMSNHLLEQYQSISNESELGKKSDYESAYNPNRLYPIPRAGKRQEMGINPDKLPFYGFDSWNHYEVSWLNDKGKPMVGIAEIVYDCRSPKLIESKSLKLYFNSFNNTKINSIEALESMVKHDLEKCIMAEVMVRIVTLDKTNAYKIQALQGESIDALDVECSVYLVEPAFLFVEDEEVSEILCSDLLKSNCLVTNQPDWGSVQINYTGKKINREGLLKYLVSFRNHNEFHEQCIERIFVDIMSQCKPTSLTVYGRYTRRGGLDINPYRSTEQTAFTSNCRLIRQ
jgi:7-cyano-7-deazaguanine reductase